MKRALLSFLSTLMLTPAWADVVINEENFPDNNFRSAIMYSGFNEDYNDVLTDEEIANATSLSVSSYSITNLKGIEFFTALTELNCQFNQLTALDLSKNKALTSISCYSNQLNVEAMDALIASLPTVSNGKLYVSYPYGDGNLCTADHVAAAKAKGWTAYDSDGNEFAGIVVLCKIDENSFPDENFRTYLANNNIDSNGDGYLTDTEVANQTYMDLSDKGITSLKGIEFFTKLTSLYCNNNQLTSLDVSKNTALTSLYCYGNKITGAQIDALAASLPVVENGQIYILDLSNENEANTCSVEQVNAIKANGWEVYYRTKYSWETFTGVLPIKITEELFPDENFRSYVSSYVDMDQDAMLSASELSRTKLFVSNLGISNLKGIELFTELIQINCSGNQISGAKMDEFIASLPMTEGGKINIINISNDSEANDCTVEQVNAIKAKGWEPLYTFDGYTWEVYSGVLPIIVNEENFPDEKFRWFVREYYGGYDGYITEKEIAEITEMDISSPQNGIASLKGIEFFTSLTIFRIVSSNLTSLDLSKNVHLTTVDCSDNQLTSLDLSKNVHLTTVDCSDNQLTSLILPKTTSLQSITCYSNKFPLEGMDVLIDGLPMVSGGQLKVASLLKEVNACTTEHVARAKAKGWAVYNSSGEDYKGKKIIAQISEEIFPDDAFRTYLSNNKDYDKDGYLTEEETTFIDIWNKNIKSLEGIEKFTTMESLYCDNNQLTSLDLSKNTVLTSLGCSNNQLTSLDLSKNTVLTSLGCSNNQLTSLDLSKNTKLTNLRCYSNQLTSLDLSKNTALTRLDCSYNKLTSLNLSENTALAYLWCYSNQLTILDLSKNNALTEVNCAMNKILGDKMDDFISSLPLVTDGKLWLTQAILNDEQICYCYHVNEAVDKGWKVYSFYSEDLTTYGSYNGEKIKGDANNDCEVNEADVKIIAGYIMGTLGFELGNFNFDAADVNGDKKINVADIVLLQKLIKN